jgi:hypothetical protein
MRFWPVRRWLTLWASPLGEIRLLTRLSGCARGRMSRSAEPPIRGAFAASVPAPGAIVLRAAAFSAPGTSIERIDGIGGQGDALGSSPQPYKCPVTPPRHTCLPSEKRRHSGTRHPHKRAARWHPARSASTAVDRDDVGGSYTFVRGSAINSPSWNTTRLGQQEQAVACFKSSSAFLDNPDTSARRDDDPALRRPHPTWSCGRTPHTG